MDRLPFIIADALEALRAGARIRPLGSPPERLTFTAEERELLDRLTRDTPDVVQSMAGDVTDALRDATPAVQPLMSEARDVYCFLVALLDQVVKLPALRRSPAVLAATVGVAVPVTTATLNRYEVEALRLASSGGGVRRGDLMAQCGISREVAWRTLAALVELRLLRRLGSGRGAWYVLRTPAGRAGKSKDVRRR